MKTRSHAMAIVATLTTGLMAAQLASPAGVLPAYPLVSSTAFANGGLSKDDQLRMRDLAPEYRLHLAFARKADGACLSHVAVAIRDRDGHTIFELSNGGPLLFVNLPQGDYQIMATANGVTQTRPVTLDARSAQDVDFFWGNGPT